MSTAVVARVRNTVCIGADTLTTWGHTKEPADFIVNHQKVGRYGDSYIATVGHASVQLILRSYYRGLKRIPAMTDVDEIFEVFRELHSSLKDDFYMNPSEESDDPFESTRFNALIANRHGIFGVFSLRTVQEFTRFFAFGSGAEYALGAMEAVYDRADSAEEVARTGLEAAARFDDGTGLPLSIHALRLDAE